MLAREAQAFSMLLLLPTHPLANTENISGSDFFQANWYDCYDSMNVPVRGTMKKISMDFQIAILLSMMV